MINLYQLLSILGASFCVLFLLQFAQLDKLRLKRRLYLYIVLLFILYLYIYELLFSFGVLELAENGGLFLYYPLLFTVYPLFYLYSRMLLFPSMGISFKVWRYHSVVPFIVLLLTISIYFRLSESERNSIYLLGYIFNTGNTKIFIFQVLASVLYYLQFIVYFYLLLKLAGESKKMFEQKNYFAKWIYIFLSGAFLYELILIFSTTFVPDEHYLALEQFFSLTFILLAGLIGFNEWLIQLKIKIEKISSPRNNIDLNMNSHQILTIEEKKEIKNEIEKFIREKKVYKNPQLKIESFAKRMHIPSKKLSNVINELYGTNFNTFINTLRIEEAKKIILGSVKKNSVEDIFLEVGFLSRSTFNRAFKANTGITPREYQQKYHKSA